MKFRTLKLALLASGVVAFGSAMAGEIDYTGYFRAGAGHNSENGKQACFKLAGAQSKYRLGNECDNYGELTFNNVIAKSDDGSVWSGHVMLSEHNYSISDASLSSGNSAPSPTNGQIGIPQVFIQADKVPEIGGASAWVGRKYYKREDVHLTDFFYWNPSGMGAGIENLAVGDSGMLFSYALFRDDLDGLAENQFAGNAGLSAWRHDFQLRGISVNPDGHLEFGLTLVQADKGSANPANTKSGFGLTAQHRQSNLFGGENKLALQYMTDSAVANGGLGNLVQPSGSNLKRFRIVEALYFQPTPTLGGQVIGVYQNDTDDLTAAQGSQAARWTTLGGRLAIGLTQHFKLDMDLGFDSAQPKGGSTGNLMKFTIAPALAVGPAYYGRPELRVFYTYAKWNDAARTNASNGLATTAQCTAGKGYDPISLCGVYGGKDNGSVFGFQAEAWW